MNIEDYTKLPYTYEARREEDGTWFGRIVELPGCLTQADTWAELDSMLEDAMRSWIETALEIGQDIPLPAVA